MHAIEAFALKKMSMPDLQPITASGHQQLNKHKSLGKRTQVLSSKAQCTKRNTLTYVHLETNQMMKYDLLITVADLWAVVTILANRSGGGSLHSMKIGRRE